MNKFVVTATALALGAGLCAPSSAMPGRFARIGFHGLAPAAQPYGATEFLKHRGARYLGHANIAHMQIDVQTPERNDAALKAYARASNTPGSIYYRKWLTPAQIASAYGTPAQTYVSIENYFAGFGIAVHPWKTRTLLTLTGSGSQFERALGTTFGRYAIRDRGRKTFTTFNAPNTAPTISSSLVGAGISLGKLVSLQTRQRHFMVTSPPQPITSGFSNARVNGASPAQLARAYDYTGAYEAGFTGQNINLGIIGTGPIAPGDVPNMRSIFNVPGSSTVTIVPSTVDGDTTPPPATGPCTASTLAVCNPEDEEAQLDTEQTSLLAYNSNVLFYLAYNAADDEIGIDLADDELQQAVDDNRADILSLSYGGCELIETGTFGVTPVPGGDATGTDPTLFAELATEGIATFVSSGDSGSAGCQRLEGGLDAPNVSYPASDPNVVAVGGTTTPMGPDGRLTGPITTWGEQTESGGAKGAGLSVDFAKPSFQTNEPTLCVMRCLPDVVLDADPFSGAAVVFNTGLSGGAMEGPVGGTSQSAPDMAAMWAVVLSACKVTPSCGGNYGSNVADPPSGFTAPASPAYRLGNPNYLWYKLGNTANATEYHTAFYDVVYGNDGVPPYAAQLAAGEVSGEGVPLSEYAGGVDPGDVSAGAGLDEATGLGAPFARALITYIVGV